MASKVEQILKRELVTAAEGRRLGKPEDVVLDPDRHEIAYLLVNRGAVHDTALVVQAEAVRSFGTDALAVDRLDSLTIAGRDPQALRLLERDVEFRRHPVLTSKGVDLGRIASIVVDERGHVLEYRVRKGLLGWLKPAQKVEPATLGTFGVEAAIVDEKRGNAHEHPSAGSDHEGERTS